MIKEKKVIKLSLIIVVLLFLTIINSVCIAAIKKEIIEDEIHVNITFCKEPIKSKLVCKFLSYHYAYPI